MNNKDKFRDILRLHNTSPQVDKIIKSLDNIGFFTAPASTRYHLPIKGGLCQHSINVYEYCMKMKNIIAPNISNEEIMIVSLYHDLNKCMNNYTENILKDGTQSKAHPYKKDTLLTGDGAVSCYLIRDVLDISLSPRMYNVISNHNIFYKDYFDNHNILTKNIDTYRLLLLLQTSDLLCSQVLEQ